MKNLQVSVYQILAEFLYSFYIGMALSEIEYFGCNDI